MQGSAYNSDHYYADIHEFAKRYLSGRILYIIQSKNIIDACNYGKVENIIPKYDDFVLNNPYPEYTEALNVVYKEANKTAAGQQAPNFKLRNNLNQDVRLSDYRGKVVYLDFWATWCAPCIKEMPNTEELKRRFSGRGVEFIYISIDDTRTKWLNYVQANNLQGVHLHDFGMGSEIAQMFNVSRVPRYIIIDRNGRIYDSNAKRPSEPGLIQDLEAALNKL